jgi:glycosyltransferase involved in cell wall biosynthesis
MRTAENLFFHYVSPGAPGGRMTLGATDLEREIASRLAAGRRCASLADYLAPTPPGEDTFTISFDDAHVSVVRHALPVLARLGVTATLFVPTAYVETTDDFATWGDLRRWRDAGMNVGSHSETHVRMPWRLYDETPAGHEARLTDELRRSRDTLARELGVAPALFAYPYGEAPDVARRAARAAGFAAAFTVRDTLDWAGDLLSIPRVDRSEPPASVAPGDTPTGLSVVVPAYRRLGILADVVTRLASQTYPKDRYEVIVVDDGSPDDLSPAVRDMPDNVRLVRHGDDDFRAGQARGRGAREARFSHLAFLDADVAVPPDFLWHLDWIHRRTEDAVVLGYLSGYNLHDLGHIHTPEATRGRDLSTLPIIPDRSREPTLRACLDNLDWLAAPWPLTYTGNLSLPRALFDRIGGFDDAFVGWGLEDIDIGYRLHRAGGRFVFARFAVGHHVVDEAEGPGRNPFRATTPTIDLFQGYLSNLALLDRRHGADPEMRAYVERSRSDIEETCSRPMTVGIEFGGAARIRSRHHRRVHRMQPGGVPREELLDRVAYAKKIGARTIFLLGGAPEEHPAFLDVVRAAKETVSWVSLQSLVYPFGDETTAAVVREAPLDGVVPLVETLDAHTYEALHGEGTFAAFARGLDYLAEKLDLKAHLVVSDASFPTLEPTLRELERRRIRIEEVSVLTPALAAPVEDATGCTPMLR